jgi:hypothetical protein
MRVWINPSLMISWPRIAARAVALHIITSEEGVQSLCEQTWAGHVCRRRMSSTAGMSKDTPGTCAGAVLAHPPSDDNDFLQCAADALIER